MATEYVRVRMENGSEKTITARRAEILGLTPYKSKPAVGRDNRPLPTKHRTELGTASATKRSSTSKSSTTEADASS